METYPVKAVARLTGLTPETLRAWERRYQAVAPARDAGGRRAYTAADVERLRAFKALVDAGHPISRVVAMDEEDRQRLIGEIEPPPAEGGDLAGIRAGLLAAVEHYDAGELHRRLGLAMATLDADLLAREVLGPTLEAVGGAWERGEMDIAQERLISAAIRSRILGTLDTAPDFRPALMLATPSGESHELGLLLLAFRAASRLIPVRYLGADLPVQEIKRLARRFRPRVIALSLVCAPEPGLVDDLATLSREGFQVWLGGRGAGGLAGELPEGCRVILTPEESAQALDGLAPAA